MTQQRRFTKEVAEGIVIKPPCPPAEKGRQIGYAENSLFSQISAETA
jgi:hypothetical protein